MGKLGVAFTAIGGGLGYQANRKKGHSVKRSIAGGVASAATGQGLGWGAKKIALGAATTVGGTVAYNKITSNKNPSTKDIHPPSMSPVHDITAHIQANARGKRQQQKGY